MGDFNWEWVWAPLLMVLGGLVEWVRRDRARMSAAARERDDAENQAW